MFDSIKDHVSPKRFGIVAYLCMIIYFFCGAIFTAILKSVRDGEMEKFSCAIDTNFHSQKVHIEKECFAMYDDVYNSPVRISAFVPFNFSSLMVVSFVYLMFVYSRIDEIEKLSNEIKKSKTGSRTTNKRRDRKSFYIFKLYLGHLVARFILGILFIILQQTLYPSSFKTEFNCVYQAPSKTDSNITVGKDAGADPSNVACKNYVASDKQLYGTIVFAVNVIFAVFALGEVFYLIRRRLFASWSCDSEFVVVYFLQKQYNREDTRLTKVVEDNSILTKSELYKKKVLEVSRTPDINYGPNTSLDEMFIDVVIQTGQAPHKFLKTMGRHEIYDVYMKVPDDSIRLEKIEDLFYSNSDTRGKMPHTILALGRPGIGKTILTRKIMRDWAREVDGFYCDKIAFFFKFRWFNFQELQNLTLKELLRFGCELEEDEFEALLDEICSESKNIILIFDGFDESVSNLQEFQNCLDRARKCSNDPDVSMSAMLLFIKLMLGQLLKDATVLVTSRPTASEFYSKFTFDRRVEILGFTFEKIEQYVESFCVNNNSRNLTPEILTYITSSSERMNLCYVPVNCFIVCVTLFSRLIDLSSDNRLPTTLTELYEEALVYFNKYHDRNENDNNVRKLEGLGFFGMENDMLVFRGELVNEKMKECGLLHCLPNPCFQIQAQFCFIHLTVQEFLAAKHIMETKTPEEITEFITSHFEEGKWHLVLQFLAGLLGKKVKIFRQYRCCVLSFTQHFRVKTDSDNVVCPLTLDTVHGMKCVSEVENDEIVAETATTSALKAVTKLYLSLVDNTFFPSDWTAVVLVCKHLKMLTSFHLSGISLNCLSEATKLLQERCVELLSLEWGDLDDLGLQNVLDALKSECHLDHEHSKLTKLMLRNNKITDVGLLQLCQYLTFHGSGLEELDIRANKITSSGMSEFSNVLSNGVCSRLEDLNLSCNDIGNDGACYLFQALIESQSKLGSLDLIKCCLTSECISLLTKVLSGDHCEITKLSLGINEIGDTGVRILCEAFQTEHCNLAGLHLNGCKFTDKCMPFLREALEHGLCSLKKLDISSNAIGDCGVGMLCEALRTEQCKVAKLWLDDCSLTDKCMPFLCKALKHGLNSLKILGISNNAIGDCGVGMLCKAFITEQCKLVVLDLCDCSLTDECMPSLCEAIGDKHCNLTELDCGWKNFTDKHLSLLSDVLKLEHCSLRLLDVEGMFTEEGKHLLRDTMEFEHCKARGLKLNF